MKKIFSLFLFLISCNVLMGQLVPYLWYENLDLKKELVVWLEQEVYITEIKEGKSIKYLYSKEEIGGDRRTKTTFYDQEGNINEVNISYWKDEFTEIYESADGDKKIKTYNEKGNLIKEVWIYPDESVDETKFLYQNDQLIKIIEKDEFGTAIEELKYDDDKLVQINSLDENGELLMERKRLYDDEGKVVESQRIQNGEVNLKVIYSYDDQSRLVKKEIDGINRLFGGKLSPTVYLYKYYSNGKLKQEDVITYTDEKKIEREDELITKYNESGLMVQIMKKDYKKGTEEIIDYTYKMKDGN